MRREPSALPVQWEPPVRQDLLVLPAPWVLLVVSAPLVPLDLKAHKVSLGPRVLLA